MSDDVLNRRRFLEQSSRLAAGGAAFLAGCSSDPLALADAGRSPLDEDMDAALWRDMARDLEGLDAGGQDLADASKDATMEEVTQFSKPPFLQILGATQARLRFETRQQEPLAVRIERRGQVGKELLATTDWRELPEFEWPIPQLAGTVSYPDVPGWHNMQSALFEDLVAGEVYDWIVHQGDGVEWRGSFEVGRPDGAAFDLGWISDTMAPSSEGAVRALARHSPTLTLHGGDLQYMTNPFDSWSGFFHGIAPLTRLGAFHTCVGNHELEGLDEYELQYRRSFEGHGFSGSVLDYSYFDFAGVRVLLLNSESDLFQAQSAQRDWMIARLEEVRASNRLRFAIVAFHRPFFTFSRSAPNFEARDRLHPVFRDYQVPLVLTGHNHCYERFEVEGVTYVVDGGGGALSYDTNASREAVLATRPSDEGLRKFESSSYGVTMARVRADDSILIQRYRSSQADTPIDEYTIG